MYASKSTYAIFAAMIVFSAAIVWIYYTTPVTMNVVPFEKNKAIQAMNESNLVKIFYVALDDGGVNGRLIGCADSLIGMEREIPATTTPLVAALALLLSDKEKVATTTGGIDLVNTFYKSNLTLSEISMKDGIADIKLRGKLTLDGLCDGPRVEAQLEETVMQFPAIQKVNISVNGKDLKEITSLR